MTTFEYNARRVMIKVFACFLFLSLTTVAASGYPVTLMIHPSNIPELTETFRLLVKSDKQTDADAYPLYEKSIQLIPTDVNKEQIYEWLKLPTEQLPQEEAEKVIQKHIESLRLVARATRCKNCNWPKWKPGTDLPETRKYRDLTFVIRLWARLEICRGRYENATVAMQTGFGMAKHLGQAPTTVQTLVGSAVGASMCRELEQFVQSKDSPNLYAALVNLPKPLIGVENAIESERANLKDYNILTRKLLEKQLNQSHDRIRVTAKRLDNHVNALQVVEAIRHYAATHDGQLPKMLIDIKDMEIPNDLMSGKPFEYLRTVEGAMLKSAIPEGGNERDAVHYEIELKK